MRRGRPGAHVRGERGSARGEAPVQRRTCARGRTKTQEGTSAGRLSVRASACHLVSQTVRRLVAEARGRVRGTRDPMAGPRGCRPIRVGECAVLAAGRGGDRAGMSAGVALPRRVTLLRDVEAGAAEHNNQLAEDRNQQYQQSTEQLALLGDRDQQCHESTECFQR